MFRILRTLFILAALVIAGAAIALFNNPNLQDRFLTRVINNQLQTTYEFGGDNLDVIFCGTASPMGQGRAQSCIAVLAGTKFFIVDTGARSAATAARLNLPLGRLNGVLLTHFHSDHISALGELQLLSWVGGRAGRLPVYGGAGVRDVVAGFNRAYGADYGYRTAHHGEALMPSKNAGLTARRINAPARGLREIYNEDGLKISVFTVTHKPIEPAFGYRFDYKGRSLVVSGDTSRDDNVARAAAKADLLAHEVLQPDLVNIVAQALKDNDAPNTAQLLHDTLDYHTTPQEAHEIAKTAEVKKLIFYHYAPVPQNRLIERMFLRGIKDTENIILADDGTHIRLPANSTDILEIN